ncbi:MAG: 4Fe-4S dicluster domain-containing protein [Syntrophomonadaceae bacterium]|nr:4Fe-4S dicluster domain-containing protein [Syntrophomonadaceae bacterium]
MEFAMDVHPSQVVRYIQLGLKDELIMSNTMWVCVSCKTCHSRCPNDIDISRINDILKKMSLETSTPADKNIPAFHGAFLDSVQSFGRVYELGMMVRYKLKTRTYMQDSSLGLKMFTKGILKLIPHGIKRRQEIQKIFHIAKEKGR